MTLFKHFTKLGTALRSRSRIIVGLLIFAVILGALSLRPLAEFVFNEQEYRFRQAYSQAYDHYMEAETVIEQRRSGQVQTYDDHLATAQAVTTSLEASAAALVTATTINGYQAWLLPFVDQHYRQYHHLKSSAVTAFQTALETMQASKRYEHRALGLLLLTEETHTKLFNLVDQETWLDTVEQLPSVVGMIRLHAEELYQAKWFDQPLYEYYLAEAAYFERVSQQFDTAEAEGSWQYFDLNALTDPVAGQDQLPTLYQQHLDYRKQIQEALLAEFRQVWEGLSQADQYYWQADLAHDRLSDWLGRVIWQSSRMEQNNDALPVEVPADLDAAVVS